MFESGKSQIVISIFFTIYILSVSIFCFGQGISQIGRALDQTLTEKPRTIYLKTERQIKSTFVSDNEKQLFVTDTEGSVYCFDLETLEQTWVSNLGGKIVSDIIETDKLIYIVTSRKDTGKNSGNNQSVASIEKQKISVSQDKNDKRNPSENRGNSIFSNNSVVWAIDKETGITTGKADLKGNGSFYLFSDRAAVYAVSEIQVSVFDIKLKDSGQNFLTDTGFINQPLFDVNKRELFLVFKNKVTRLVLKDGKFAEEKIEFNIEKSGTIDIFAGNVDTYFIGDSAGNLSAYDVSGRKRVWKFRAGGKISDIEIFGNKIIVSSYDNFLYCLNVSDGEKIWKKRLPGRISKIKKSSENDFFVRSSYSADYYLIDVETGNITAQYSNFKNPNSLEFELKTTPRLIIIETSNSIDIYKKN